MFDKAEYLIKTVEIFHYEKQLLLIVAETN